MTDLVCRRCGRLFDEKTGEYVGAMIFGQEARGVKICKQCLIDMKLEEEERPWFV